MVWFWGAPHTHQGLMYLHTWLPDGGTVSGGCEAWLEGMGPWTPVFGGCVLTQLLLWSPTPCSTKMRASHAASFCYHAARCVVDSPSLPWWTQLLNRCPNQPFLPQVTSSARHLAAPRSCTDPRPSYILWDAFALFESGEVCGLWLASPRTQQPCKGASPWEPWEFMPFVPTDTSEAV